MMIHQLFEEQAAKQPDAVALETADRFLTYDELNRRANRMAWRLIESGIRPEQFAAVRIPRSIEAIVAMLGVLKAGAAWLYLESDLPDVRVATILENAQPQAVIASDHAGFGAGRDHNPDVAVTPDHAGCLLYTSGSTGQPKGVVAVHWSFTARIESGQLPDIVATDVCCLNSSLAFGLTASRFLLPLAQGARVVIPTDTDVKDVKRFAAVLAEYRVTSLFLPPVLLRALLEVDLSHTAIRAVTSGGSTLTAELADAFFESLPTAMLVNTYGSAEIGSTLSLQVLTRETYQGIVTIGRPVPAASMYLLDEHMQPVADGESGELYVGAPYLSREYLHLPQLTAERFLPDPFSPGKRVYRTGDMARKLPNGEIQLGGRRDHQVKIRGHRVELGEIEAALQRHPGVREAVVSVQQDALIAYVAGNATMQELRAFVREQLPAPMHPHAYLLVTGLPRTGGGTVDRGKLPPYDPARPEMEAPYEPPRSEAEQELAKIWGEALKVRQVGIHDNFLDLGGDSLAAMRAIVGMEARFGLKVAMDALFETTVAELARTV